MMGHVWATIMLADENTGVLPFVGIFKKWECLSLCFVAIFLAPVRRGAGIADLFGGKASKI